MQRIETLLAEFEHEAQTTRRHLARVPEERFDWRPHLKSYTAGRLASHLVDCVRFAAAVFSADELAIDLSTYTPYLAPHQRGLLDAFDAGVARAVDAMTATDDREATRPWRLVINGKPRFERAREAAFRDLTMSHLIHHRGQLSVYLRLMDVPVPGSYGPTADER